jgi:hypothetical protein
MAFTVHGMRRFAFCSLVFGIACGESVVGDTVHTIPGETAPDGACALTVDGAPSIVRAGRYGGNPVTMSMITAYCGGTSR